MLMPCRPHPRRSAAVILPMQLNPRLQYTPRGPHLLGVHKCLGREGELDSFQVAEDAS
jgi:hypothetical protein